MTKRSEYFPEKPHQIKLSLTNACNYECVMCPNPNFKMKRGYMSNEMISKIIAECAREGIKHLALGSTGEPLLHKNFVDHLRDAKSKGLWVSTTSNCTMLTPKLCDAMLEEGLNSLRVSIYSASREQHIKYAKRDAFDHVVGNLKYLFKAWQATDKTLQIKMDYLPMAGINDRESFMGFWKPLADEVGITIEEKPLINWGGTVSIASIRDQSKGGATKTVMKGDADAVQIACPHLQAYLFIIHDGTFYPCCNILENTKWPELEFGNYNDMSIMDVWNSEKYQTFKEKQFRLDVADYPPCRSCSEIWAKKPSRISLSSITRKLTEKLVHA